jgi:hypothetical protein
MDDIVCSVAISTSGAITLRLQLIQTYARINVERSFAVGRRKALGASSAGDDKKREKNKLEEL